LINTPNDDQSLLDKKFLIQLLEIENKIKDLPDWKLFCKAKSTDDLSCSDSSIFSPLAYLKLLGGDKWMEKS
jgi:hypothetical protein